MSFFANGAVNRTILHSAVQALASAGGGIFFLVFLLRAGVPVPLALVAQAAIQAGRFILRPVVLPLARRFGIRPLVIAGTLILALQYPLLAEVHGVGVSLVLLVVTASAGEVLYWVSYNAYFSAIGDAEHRGHQVSAREALVSVVGVAAPVVGAWTMLTFGPRPMFAAVGLIQAFAALPLIGAPEVSVKEHAPGAVSAARFGALISLADGWFDAWFIFAWQIALFLALSSSIAGYGGAMALAQLAGAVGGLLLGRHIDAGHGRRAAIIGGIAVAAVTLLRAASLNLPWLAVMANALGPPAMSLLGPAIGGAVYNLAKRSPCPFRFHLVTEAAWDTGSFVACIVAAALVASGVPLSFGLALGLPGLLGIVLVVRHIYALNASARRT